MSTRANIYFIDAGEDARSFLLNTEDMADLNPEIFKRAPGFYKHGDGYPEGVLPLVVETLKDDGTRNSEAESISAWTLYAFMKFYDENYVRVYNSPKLSYYLNPERMDKAFLDYIYLIINGEDVVIYENIDMAGTFKMKAAYNIEDDLEEFLNDL